MKNIRQMNIPISNIKSFIVTGLFYNSTKRFSNKYNSFNSAMMINLWNGSVWAELKNGKRKLLKRIKN